ncbi:hypothetical protein BSKO_07269 [Bryopsis sp. KO-2023]|nr:hypothetical protein BSKO_07269 [Bryopsis sp. KO-2023]
MKRERDDDREVGVSGEKIFRGEGSRGRGRGRGGRGGTRRPPSRGLDYAGYDYSQGYDVPVVEPDEVELKADIEVRREMVGPVIGRAGQTVSQIRKETGAQIHIRDSVPGETDQIIEVKGTRIQVENAAEQIRQVLAGEDEDYGYHHPGIKTSLILVHIAPEMVGCLIGKAGKNVKSIKEETGANIRVDAQVDGQPFQTVNITGSVRSVIDAFLRVGAKLVGKVGDCMRSFDPKKSKLMRGIDDQSQLASVPIPQNPVYSASANFGAGLVGVNGVLGSDQQQYLAAGQQQQTFVIQAPVQTTPGGPPAVLVLQPDGTYQPAPVIYQSVQTPQTPTGGTNLNQTTATATALTVSPDLTPTSNLANMVQYGQYGVQPTSQAAQSPLVLPPGGTVIQPAQNIVGIQPTGIATAVSTGIALSPGVIGQQQ